MEFLESCISLCEGMYFKTPESVSATIGSNETGCSSWLCSGFFVGFLSCLEKIKSSETVVRFLVSNKSNPEMGCLGFWRGRDSDLSRALPGWRAVESSDQRGLKV